MTNLSSLHLAPVTDGIYTEAGRDPFATAWADYHRRLYFAAYKIVRNCAEPADTARDLVVDAFVKALDKRSEFRGESSLYTVLYRVVCHAALDHIKAHAQARRSGQAVSADHAGSEVQPVAAESTWLPSDVTPRGFGNPEQAYLRKERAELVNEALDLLNDRQRRAWELVRLEGHSSVKAASILGVSQPTAYRALSAADAAVNSHLRSMCR